MKQNYENNKRRIQMFKLTADVKDDNGMVHHFVDGYEYVEIGGIKWATCNVGAEKETDSGLYFAWGETVGYKDANEKHFTLGDYKFWDHGNTLKYINDHGLTKLEPCDDAATQNMGSNWRMPNDAEYRTLLHATNKRWVTINGVSGMLFIDITDSSKKLFFPAVGFCYDGSVNSVFFYGYYWSSSLYVSNSIHGKDLYFNNCGCTVSYANRYIGFLVRGII